MARRAGIALSLIVAILACAARPMAAATTSSLGRLVIPKLGLDVPIEPSLAYGPAFYPGSGRPGQPYTVAIAGHRTTHTHPFWALNELHRGDSVIVIWHRRAHAYRVTETRIVLPTDWSLVSDRGHERLVLSTCTPRFSARERLVVVALPSRS